jgi:CRISPR-associated exonuclease Cas4
MEHKTLFRVTDVKQFAYCPRVVYYTYCLPLIRPTTYKMEAGVLAHVEEEEREARRGLRVYGLEAERGERSYDLALSSARLNVSGRIDLAVRYGAAGGEEAIPVEYKDSTHKLGEHFKLQLMVYGLLLEEVWGIPARRGFLYAIPLRRAEEVALGLALRRKVEQITAAMTRMVEREAMPEPTGHRAACLNCEFRRFCNDV